MESPQQEALTRFSSAPPVAPIMCFPCLTASCKHRDRSHGGDLIPALTYFQGTTLCLDCAIRAAVG